MNAPYIEIKVLSQRLAAQKEQMQRLVELQVPDSVTDEMVPIYMEKAKALISMLVYLGILSDESLLSLPKIVSDDEGEEGEEMPGPSGVAVMVETQNDESFAPVTFTGSHRIYYAAVDVFQVNGAQLDSVKRQLKAIAPFHSWFKLVS